MTNEQQAETTGFLAFDTVLTHWNGTWNANVATGAMVTDFRNAKKKNAELAIASGADNSGFSEDKLTAKKVAAEALALLTGCAAVRFNKLGKGDLANQLDIHDWSFANASDSNCGTMMKSNSKLMRDNIDDLDPDYVTEGDLDAVDLLIQKFIDLQGTSEAVHSASPEITAEFANSFAPVKDEMENVLFIVRKNFKVSTPKFITELEAAAKKPTVNIHHTIISIHATKKSNGEPVEGILFSETKSGKSGKTDFKGNAEIDRVKSGDDVMTGVLAGITVYSGHINNKRGKNNHYNVVIESM